MYKSLLGKKIESLALHWKVWRVHFLALTSSLAPVRAVSNICWGCFLPACPNKRHMLQALCAPRSHKIHTSPRCKWTGRGIPGQGWATVSEVGAAEQSDILVNPSWKENISVNRGVQSVSWWLSILRPPRPGLQTPHAGLPFSDIMNGGFVCATAVLSGGCVVLRWKARP